MASMTKERRRHPRVSIAIEVDVQSEHNFYVGRTRDISVGGLFLETTIGIDIGARVGLNLTLDGRKFKLEGEVMWTLAMDDGVTSGVGVSFVTLAPAAKRAIEAFMKKREPEGIDVEPEGPQPPPLPYDDASPGSGKKP